jgi:hypothetical protein
MTANVPGKDRKTHSAKSTSKPKVHGMFAANCNGTAVFYHAEKVPLKSGPNKGKLELKHRNVDSPELARGSGKLLFYL